MNILFEDNEILVCVKPAGIATESADVRSKDMVSEVKFYLKGGYVGLIHRLDQPVSGLLVFAKTPAAAAGLSEQVGSGSMRKYYRAEVEGIVAASDGPVILTDHLIKDKGSAVVVPETAKDARGHAAKCAKLQYEVLSVNEEEDTTTLRILLMTGRFHQIRAQLSHLGHPILGDRKYGAKKPAASKEAAGIALCAYELIFSHPVTGKELHFTL